MAGCCVEGGGGEVGELGCRTVKGKFYSCFCGKELKRALGVGVSW